MPPAAPPVVSDALCASGAPAPADAGASDAATVAATAAAIAALAALASGASAPLGSASAPYAAGADGKRGTPSHVVPHHGRSARRAVDAGGGEGLSFEAWLALQTASPTATNAQEAEPTGGDATVGGGTVRLPGSVASQSPDGEEERALRALRQLQRMHQPRGNGTATQVPTSARDEATASPDESGPKGSFLAGLQSIFKLST